MTRITHRLGLGLAAVVLLACNRPAVSTATTSATRAAPAPAAAAPATTLQGTVSIDGSSTVFPISEAAAEEFGKIHPKVRVTVGLSGTGGGFKRFGAGETDISDASRPIKPEEEQVAAAHGVTYVEIPVAYDGIAVVVNPKNAFVDHLTMAELKKIWEPGSKVKTWRDVRATWPDQPIRLYGPGTDSGTFDYFTGAVNGVERASRADFTASEDDNVLVQGVSGDAGALGYFGYAYYVENKARLKLVPLAVEAAPIAATAQTIEQGTYPLARPIFIYVSQKAAARPEVDAFVTFYLAKAATLSQEVGYVPLSAQVYMLAQSRYTSRTAGSAVRGLPKGKTLVEALRAK